MGSFSSSKNSIILLVVLVAALLFAVYYYLVFPKQNEVEALNHSIGSLQSEIIALEASMAKGQLDETYETANLFDLRKKLPKSRELDELLLNIEEIEYLTGTIVTSISFNSYDISVSESSTSSETEAPGLNEPTQEPIGQLFDGSQLTEGETVNEDIQEQELASNLVESLPPELKLITFNLEVDSPNYDRLLEFIDEIEHLERIMRIDAINYLLPGEEGVAEESIDLYSATLQVTTFYYEGE